MRGVSVFCMSCVEQDWMVVIIFCVEREVEREYGAVGRRGEGGAGQEHEYRNVKSDTAVTNSHKHSWGGGGGEDTPAGEGKENRDRWCIDLHV